MKERGSDAFSCSPARLMVADKVLRRPGDGTTLVEAMEAGLAAVCHSNWQVPAR